MSNRIQWIQHKGKRILFGNWSGIREEAEYLRAIEELEAEILKQPKGHRVLTLLDQSGSIATPAITERSKRMIATAKEKGIPDSPTALVGNTGFQKAIIQAMQFFRRDIYIADSIEAGKDWLIEQADE